MNLFPATTISKTGMSNVIQGLEAQPEYVEETRQLGKDNFFFFCRAILGFDKLTDRFHKEMCDNLQGEGALRRLWLLPRDHFKSTIVSIAFPIWLLVNNPEERILIAADTATRAEGKLKTIKSLILESPLMRAFYPEIIPSNTNKTTWSDSAIQIPRKGSYAEPSISTVGAGGAIVGAHFTHIILDDLITREAASSPSVMKDVKEWVDNVESLLVEPYTNTIDVVGTRWHHNDIYAHIDEHWPKRGSHLNFPYYSKYEKGFWDGKPEHDQVLFPELYEGVENAKDYAKGMAMQNAYLWSCNYLNDPQIPEAEFDLDDLNYYSWDKDEENVLYETRTSARPSVRSIAHMDIYITCDPAYSKKRGASNAAIITSGVLPTGEVFILEAKRGKWGGQGVIKEILKSIRKYRSYAKAIGIEATGTQEAFVDDFRKEMRVRQLYTPVESLRPGSVKNKEARIRFHLQRFVAERRLYIQSDMYSLEKEFRHFPLANDKDLLDAMAYAAEFYWDRLVMARTDDDAEGQRVESREATRNRTTGY